jgi:hypothetical protein
MPLSLDRKAYSAIQWGDTGSYIPMPMMPGSGASEPSGLQKIFMAANSAYESINYIRGLALPTVDFIGCLHRSWFSTANMQKAFTNKTDGFLSSVGKVAYRMGSGNNTDEVSGQFAACYFSGMTLAAGGVGSPVVCRAGLLPAGTRGALPGSIAASPAGQVGYFLSDGVTFGGFLTDVLGWTLTLVNGMTPYTACQGEGAVNLEQRIYPASYLNAPIGAVLSLIQPAGATVVDDDDLSEKYQIGITLSSGELTGGATPASVTFNFQGLQPDRAGQVTGGLSIVNRNYVGQANGDGSGGTFLSLSIS